MTEHDGDCTCFRCKISSLQVKRKPQTHHKFRPVVQPNNPAYVETRPDGSQVVVRDAEGRTLRAADIDGDVRRKLDDLKRRSHESLQQAHANP